MSAKHTPAPWDVTAEPGLGVYVHATDAFATDVAEMICTGHSDETVVANARRIVACVNACDGIPTEALEKGRMSPDAFEANESRADKAEAQVDELLAALKAARRSLHVANDEPGGPIRDTIWHGPAETLLDFIDYSIEKAEGRAA